MVGHQAGRRPAGADPVRPRPGAADRRRRGDHRTLAAGRRGRAVAWSPCVVMACRCAARRVSRSAPDALARRCGSSTATCCTYNGRTAELARVVAAPRRRRAGVHRVHARPRRRDCTSARSPARSRTASSIPRRRAGGSALWSRYPLTEIAAPPACTSRPPRVVDVAGGVELYVVHPPNPLDHLRDWLRRARRPRRAVRTAATDRRSSSATSTPRYWHPPFRRISAAGWRDAHHARRPRVLQLMADRQARGSRRSCASTTPSSTTR